MLCTGGLTLHLCVAAMLVFKPIPKENINLESKEVVEVRKEYINKHNLPITVLMKQVVSDFKFQCLLLNTFLLCTGSYMASYHVLAYALHHGIQPYVAGAMLSVLGFCNLAGRLALSLLIQHPRVNTIYVHALSTCITGKKYI